MKKLLISLMVMFALSTFAEEDEMYIVATGTCSVKESSAIKNSALVYHRYFCYPMKVSAEGYEKRFVIAAYRSQIERKFSKVNFESVDVAEFSSKKEASEHYRTLLKTKRYERLTLPKSSIEKFRLKHAEETGEVVGGPTTTSKKSTAKKTSSTKRPYYDIYD
jgi:hypothetical protein